jgi:hypothetical protein
VLVSDKSCLHCSAQGGLLLFAELLFNVLYRAERWVESNPELAVQPPQVLEELLLLRPHAPTAHALLLT